MPRSLLGHSTRDCAEGSPQLWGHPARSGQWGPKFCCSICRLPIPESWTRAGWEESPELAGTPHNGAPGSTVDSFLWGWQPSQCHMCPETPGAFKGCSVPSCFVASGI